MLNIDAITRYYKSTWKIFPGKFSPVGGRTYPKLRNSGVLATIQDHNSSKIADLLPWNIDLE